MLKCLASGIKQKRVRTNATPLTVQNTFCQTTSFICEGVKQRTDLSLSDSIPLNPAREALRKTTDELVTVKKRQSLTVAGEQKENHHATKTEV